MGQASNQYFRRVKEIRIQPDLAYWIPSIWDAEDTRRKEIVITNEEGVNEIGWTPRELLKI